jgi:glycosyltransferase involved in cell wall biosynthesis
MRILIDARLYGLEHAGPGRYVKNLIDALMALDKENDYVLLLRRRHFGRLKCPKNFKKKLADFHHYTFREQFRLPGIIREEKPDLVHFPFFNVPILYFGKYVVTIHDLTMHKYKGGEATTRSLPRYILWRIGYYLAFLKAIYGSKKIIVPSKSVRKDIVSYYRVKKNKIVVSYEGVDEAVSKARVKYDVLKKYSITKPYFIYSGSAYPHKNLKSAIKAVKNLNKQSKDKVFLVITSSRSIFLNRMVRWTKELDASAHVKFTGFVSDAELGYLFKNSLGFVYPTLSEGFGLPGLEAMKSGTLVLASDIDVLKEVYKDKAIYFNPKKTESLEKRMQEVVEMDEKKRRKLISSYNKLLKNYSWNKMAKETLKVYESSFSLR